MDEHEYSDLLRDHYEHESWCTKTNFSDTNDRGLKTCLDCAGVFDSEGKGVKVQDKRFDENYTAP